MVGGLEKCGWGWRERAAPFPTYTLGEGTCPPANPPRTEFINFITFVYISLKTFRFIGSGGAFTRQNKRRPQQQPQQTTLATPASAGLAVATPARPFTALEN